ncbi:MAG TPA: SAM-dependent methyltransferase [Rhabdochlamydiaceae bacterium]|jgi:16S rRNA (cytidine1402-2'-O)-methyltransferase
MKSLLYLLPNVLGDQIEHASVLPISVDRAVAELDHLIAESEKEGRRFLKRFAFPEPKTFRDIPIHLLNEHTSDEQRKALLHDLLQGGTWGLISDCGMPCLADPGEELVLHARRQGVSVRAFAGPSSLMLALVLSGLGGQRFTFHGYLPKEKDAQIQKLKEIEHCSKKTRFVHLFIEAPYRNDKLFAQLLESLDAKVWLCVAKALTLPEEWVSTQRIEEWRKTRPPSLDNLPTVFLVRS